MADGAVGCDSAYAQLPVQHDPAYYEQWNRERQEAVARGEDPNAKFLAMVAQKQANSTEGWWRRVFRKGGKTHGERLTDGEVKKGLEHDVRGV